MRVFQRRVTITGGTVVSGRRCFVRNVSIQGHSFVRPDGSDGVTIDISSLILTPGLVDIQINGWGGYEFAGNPSAVEMAQHQLPRHGVTSFLPTACSLPLNQYQELTCDVQTKSGAEVLGWHLEGPFINPDHAGIHPKAYLAPQFEEAFWRRLFATRGIRMMTLAPECVPDALFDLLAEFGIATAIGHSAASDAQLRHAKEKGASNVTHLFNAMPSFHHRVPGIIGVALGERLFGYTIISDLYHLCQEAIQIAWRCHSNGLALVSDGAPLIGSTESEGVFLGRCIVARGEEVVTSADGTLAGSLLPLDGQVTRFMAATGCSFAEAVRAASEVPAIFAGVQHKKGRIAPGFDADAVIWEQTEHGPEVFATLARGSVAFAKPEFWNRVRDA